MRNLEALKEIIEQEENFEDYIENEGGEESTQYDIMSYGIDFDVEGLVRRLKREEIFIPEFQRGYVWKMPEASRFIESLLLGLPVPGVFLAQEPDTGRMLVIDGQQRLLSLKYFYQGEFKPIENRKQQRAFLLSKVKNQFEGKGYDTLKSRDKINLDNSVIHATVVKQVSPSNDDTSIYHIFERLNSGGKKLTPQEIRVAVYHGELIDLVKELNEIGEWRKIFGPENDRMKDVELILRFLAMLEKHQAYTKPMVEFINKFCANNRSPLQSRKDFFTKAFSHTIKKFYDSIDDKLFRPVRALNVALFEACMVGLAMRLMNGSDVEDSEVNIIYYKLLENSEFQELISHSTTDVKNVKRRIALAIEAYSGTSTCRTPN